MRTLLQSRRLFFGIIMLPLSLTAQTYDMHDYLTTAPGYAMANSCSSPGSCEAQYFKPGMCPGYPTAWSHLKGAYQTNTTPGAYNIPRSSEPFYEASYTHDGVTEPFIWITAEIGKSQSGGITKYTAFRFSSTGIKGARSIPRYIPQAGTTWSVSPYAAELWYRKTAIQPDYTAYPSTGCPNGLTVCGGVCAYPSCIGDCNVIDYNIGPGHTNSARHVTLRQFPIDARTWHTCPGVTFPADVDAIELITPYGSVEEHYYYGRWLDPTLGTWQSLGIVKWEYLVNGVITQQNNLAYLVAAQFGGACTTCPP